MAFGHLHEDFHLNYVLSKNLLNALIEIVFMYEIATNVCSIEMNLLQVDIKFH